MRPVMVSLLSILCRSHPLDTIGKETFTVYHTPTHQGGKSKFYVVMLYSSATLPPRVLSGRGVNEDSGDCIAPFAPSCIRIKIATT